MNMLSITPALLASALTLALSVPVVADEAPKGVTSKTEIQLQDMTPTVKDFSIKLQGLESVKEELLNVRDIIKNIMRTSRLNVEKVPISGEPDSLSSVKTFENLEIVVAMTRPETAGTPYKVDITLQEAGTQGAPKSFDYLPDNVPPFYKAVQTYLMQTLNLRPE